MLLFRNTYAIIAIAAIVSPVITTLINTGYQIFLKVMDRREKEQERTIEHQRKIIENYLKFAFQHFSDDSDDFLQKYGESFGLVLLYVPPKTRDKIIEIDNLSRKNKIRAKIELGKIVNELQFIIEEW